MQGKSIDRLLTASRVLLVGACLFAAAPGHAGGPYPVFSGISAAAEDAFTAGTNPAGMTRFDETQKRFDLLSFFSDSTWESRVGDSGPLFRTEDSNTTVVPFGALVKPLRDDWVFGFTFLGAGFSDDYGQDSPGRYFIQEYDLIYVSAFPSIARKVTDKLSLAASLALSYSSYEQEKAVRNVDPALDDGKLVIDADGFSVGFGLSALYEINDRTRFGVVYSSELDPEMDGGTEFSGLGPTREALLERAGLLNANIDVESRLPQSLVAGVYHEFEGSKALTFDAAWIDFSEFKLAELYVNENQLTESTVAYDDILALSASYSWPLSERTRIGFGALYVDDMVGDDERSLSFRADSLWGVGAGVQWQWKEQRTVHVNLSYFEPGDAPVSSLSLGPVGPVTGRFTDRQTIFLQVALSLGSGPRR